LYDVIGLGLRCEYADENRFSGLPSQ